MSTVSTSLENDEKQSDDTLIEYAATQLENASGVLSCAVEDPTGCDRGEVRRALKAIGRARAALRGVAGGR